MSEWLLVLLVFTTDQPTPGGIVLGGMTTEADCWKRARQDTPRIAKLYPDKQSQWVCIKRDAKVVERKEPEA